MGKLPALVLLLAAFPAHGPAAEGRASVILISVDTLRADRVGCYGYRGLRTPHLDALAHGGTVFGQVDSPVPMTLPAHTSLLTSTWPFVHGVQENGQKAGAGAATIAGVLKAHG